MPGRSRRSRRPAQLDSRGGRLPAAVVLRRDAGRLIQAENVVRRLPGALDAHEAGAISDYHLRILFELTSQLDDTQIGKVEAAVLERAADQTPGQFRASVERAAARVDARAAEKRHA